MLSGREILLFAEQNFPDAPITDPKNVDALNYLQKKKKENKKP